MSLTRIANEVIRPYLVSIEESDLSGELERILGDVRKSGAGVPQIAVSIEPEDLESTGLPLAVRKTLAKEIREDSIPKAVVSNDPHSRLRPASLDHVVGHVNFKELVTTSVIAARRRDSAMRHILLSGPRGLGKTTLALAIAHERGVDVRVLAGVQLTHPQDVSAEVLRWKDHEVVFIDEIHGMGKAAQETLYGVMEDGRLPVVEKRRSGPRVSTSVPAPTVTIIGATTNPSKLLAPFRNRFGMKYTLQFYSLEEMVEIGHRSSCILGVNLTDENMALLAATCRDNPRTLNEFLIQLSDLAEARGNDEISEQDVRRYLMLNGYDENGLRPDEQRYLDCLERSSGTASLTTLASALDVEQSEVEGSIEPWLLRNGFVTKTSRGRQLTERKV